MYDKFITSQVEGDPRSVFYKRVEGINFPRKKKRNKKANRTQGQRLRSVAVAALLIKFTREK